jgi:hypothetical protein
MRSVAWLAVLLLLAGAARAAASPQPQMPDPCIAAPNLPFCR